SVGRQRCQCRRRTGPRCRVVEGRRSRERIWSVTAVPSVSYSITVRLEVPAGGASVSQLTTAVEQAGGAVTALDVTASGPERLRIDVTCAARDSEHAELLVAAMRGVSGVVIGKVRDPTFFMHLADKTGGTR